MAVAPSVPMPSVISLPLAKLTMLPPKLTRAVPAVALPNWNLPRNTPLPLAQKSRPPRLAVPLEARKVPVPLYPRFSAAEPVRSPPLRVRVLPLSTIKLRPVPWSLLVPVTFNSAPVLMERVPFLRSRTFVALTTEPELT